MAQLTIEFIRDTLSDGFYLGVDVAGPPGTVDVDPACIVARVGRDNTPESLTRIGTLNDLSAIPAAPAGGYNQLYEEGFGAIVPIPGDYIRLNEVPPLWAYLGYIPMDHHVSAYDPTYKTIEVVPGDEFPAYGGRLSFSLYTSTYTLRGIFTRSGAATLDLYSPAWDDEVYYRLQTIHAPIEELQNAINKFTSLKIEAQSLVDSTELYLDEYDGTSTEIYT